MLNTVRFRTFKVIGKDNRTISKVVAATALLETTEENEKEFSVQFSFCSPKDKFDKLKGQFIAAKRLESFRGITFKNDPSKKVSETVKNLLMAEINRKPVRWLQDVTKDQIV